MTNSSMARRASKVAGRSSHGRQRPPAATAHLAEAQTQAVQRHGGSADCPLETRLRVRPPPMSNGHPRYGPEPRRIRPSDRLGRASPRAGQEARRVRGFLRADRAVHRERNRMMARTKRSRRSYGAGEWGRNRVRVFPDPKTGIFQMEWRENGRRRTKSLKHRDWTRAKRQIHWESNHRKKPRKFNQDCTICLSCRRTMSDSMRSLQRGTRNRLAGTPNIDTRPVGPILDGTPVRQSA